MYSLDHIQKLVKGWEMDWMYRIIRVQTNVEQRKTLAEQLRELRAKNAPKEVIGGFIRWMLWVGVYPPAMRKFRPATKQCTCPSVACELHGLPAGSSSGGW